MCITMHNFFDSIFVKIISRIAKNVNICETEVTLTKECAGLDLT